MSYTLQLISTPVPTDDDRAWLLVETLSEESTGPADASLQALYVLLKQKYGEFGDDDSPWTDGPLHTNFSGNFACLGLTADPEEDVLPFIVDSARTLGVTLFDEQNARIYRPNDSPSLAIKASGPPPFKMQDAVKILVAGLRPSLDENGFVFEKGRGGISFIRKTIFGAHKISFCFVERGPYSKTSVTVFIRFDAMATLYADMFDLDKNLLDSSFSSLTRLAWFSGGRKEYSLGSIEEARVTALDTSSVILNEVIPFLNGVSDLNFFDRLLNSDEFPGFSAVSNIGTFVDSLIVARLVGNPNFDRLVDLYQEKTANHIDRNKLQMEKCIHYLRNLPDTIFDGR